MIKIELYLQSLHTREKLLGIMVIILLYTYLFYNQVYLSFIRNNNFSIITKMSLEQDVKEVKALTITKPIAQIKKDNSQTIQQINVLKQEQLQLNNILNSVDNFNIIRYANRHTLYEENNISTLKLKVEFPLLLQTINKINQYYKINYLLLQDIENSEILGTITVTNKIINPFYENITTIENPFFNIQNVFELNSIIGNRAKINGQWYSKDNNISNKNMTVHQIKNESVILKDSKNRQKEIFLQ